MPIDRTGDPWPRTADKDFSGGPPRRRALLIGGVAAALLLGLLFGLWARPQLTGSKPTSGAAPSAADLATPSASQVPITVNPPPAPEPLPRAPGRLETLPPEMAAAAREQAEALAPSLPPLANVAPGAPDASLPAPPEIAPVPPAASEPAPVPGVRASFDCATAGPGAEQMVCADPALASADRQMARTYRRALRAGAEPDVLRQEQRDWAAIREDAARHSPRALAQVYDQRIRELNQIADEAPGGE
ncbi:lysozyme inhibitor LprI family protein [Phenylobacterium sp. LjRoot225]|uniref:lysozyme inhibitor LprI family protein n=1 Tax=Phenylobacterium sp. LjRoot225 TaxID=3342285 RepID=UPI003ED0B34B